MELKSGIYPNVPMDEYAQWPAVNAHRLWTLRTRSPLHSQWEWEHPQEPTPSMGLGILLHTALLEPARWANEVVMLPEDAPRRPTQRQIDAKKPSPETVVAVKWWAEWNEKTKGKTLVDAEQKTTLDAMAESVRRLQCHTLVTGGQAETCIVWEDPETGLMCKGRLDYQRVVGWQHCITDLKTCTNAGYDAFQRAINQYGYHHQAAFYCWGWEALTGETPSFTWLCVETDPPYAAKAWECEPSTLDAGKLSYRAALAKYAECLAKNEWPGYGEAVEFIGLSDWALKSAGVNAFQVHME